MDLFVEGGKNILKIRINQYDPIVKFDLHQMKASPLRAWMNRFKCLFSIIDQ
jgi:hypothetical protein